MPAHIIDVRADGKLTFKIMLCEQQWLTCGLQRENKRQQVVSELYKSHCLGETQTEKTSTRSSGLNTNRCWAEQTQPMSTRSSGH